MYTLDNCSDCGTITSGERREVGLEWLKYGCGYNGGLNAEPSRGQATTAGGRGPRLDELRREDGDGARASDDRSRR